jgi:beta-ureidopropionase / N-carbamoyl-L-amino-acid hydrolase
MDAQEVDGASQADFDALCASLADIGRDRRSGGYRRFAWTAADLELREWFADQAARRGMAYEQNRNSNQWAWWGTPAPGAVVTGSHLDSVPDGGAFDGPLGVVSGFLAVDWATEPSGPAAHRLVCGALLGAS